MAKQFMFKGYIEDELKRMSLGEFIKIIPSRQRRSINRGIPPKHKKMLEKIRALKPDIEKGKDIVIKTHLRDMIVYPEMIGVKLGIHTGKEFQVVTIMPEMVSHYLGEFAITRKKVSHSSPGIGATRSSMYVPLR